VEEVVLDFDFAEAPACLESVADDSPIALIEDFQRLSPNPLKDPDRAAM
jgi:hypothetical protein